MEHSMSQYVNKAEMPKAVMAENEQLKAQLAAAQQGAQQSIEQDVRAIVDLLKNRELAEHIGQTELGRELEHEITKLYNATRPTTQGLDAARYSVLRVGRWWSVIDGMGKEMKHEALDAAADRVLAAQAKQGGAA